jgi:hypothetical protein
VAFVRDVVRIGGRKQATCFAPNQREERGQVRTLAEETALVRRALRDRAE